VGTGWEVKLRVYEVKKQAGVFSGL
jgi:hypothetical protein